MRTVSVLPEKGKITMRIRDTSIIDRTIEELSRINNDPHELAKLVGCPTQLIRYWLDGVYTPSAFYLRRFHEIGCDVLYILTGKHYTISGGDTDV
jgi:hypothetical protein